MKKLPEEVQHLLQYAAVCGSSFSLSTLAYCWEKDALKIHETYSSDLTGMLDLAKESNWLESCGSDGLRFVHDKVQEAVLSLTDLVDSAFQHRLGICLLQGLLEKEVDVLLFDVMDLINKHHVTERADLALMNLKAARKARDVAAFLSGAKYAAHGIDQLPVDRWGDSRELTVQIYTIGAQCDWFANS